MAQLGAQRRVVVASGRGEYEKCCTLEGSVCNLESPRNLDGDTATKGCGSLEEQTFEIGRAHV